ncbi:MAG: hypothetical protein A2Z25_03540 [Planctomycetes bacterium RBG_16_55_9]|nr:MAG: hypothetical protein A2Z25_03540 [Planctomycetes bacterium RBG_16_55_9]
MKLYLYAIIDSPEPTKGLIRGLRDAGVYNVPYYDIGAAVSKIDRAGPQVTEPDAIQHEAVVEKLMAGSTVLPVRFQTIFDQRDSLLSMMRSHYADFKDNLQRLRDKIEFGVKVIWPADQVKQSIIEELQRDGQETSESLASMGKRFIKERFERYKVEKELESRADEFVGIMDTFLGEFAVEKRLEKLKTENLLADAVYLVEKTRESSFRGALGRLRNAHPGFKFLLSGPWPAYNFVTTSDSGNSAQTGLFPKADPSQISAGMDFV